MVLLIPGGGRLDHRDRESELWFGSGVVILVAFQEVTEREIKLFGAICFAGIVIPSQLEGLRHVTQGFLH
jgi:hypothetical protein